MSRTFAEELREIHAQHARAHSDSAVEARIQKTNEQEAAVIIGRIRAKLSVAAKHAQRQWAEIMEIFDAANLYTRISTQGFRIDALDGAAKIVAERASADLGLHVTVRFHYTECRYYCWSTYSAWLVVAWSTDPIPVLRSTEDVRMGREEYFLPTPENRYCMPTVIVGPHPSPEEHVP
jgi:hypothetical protein